MVPRSIVLLAVLSLMAACQTAPVAARAVHPTKPVVTPSPSAPASPDATPAPTPSPAPDSPAAEPVAAAPPAAPAAPPPPAACAASATGTLTIEAVRTATGQATLFVNVSVGCSVTALLSSNYGLRHSFPCRAGVPCADIYVDSPPASAGATGVTYSLGVTDATGQSRALATAKGVPFGPPTPLPVSPSPSPSH